MFIKRQERKLRSKGFIVLLIKGQRESISRKKALSNYR